MNVEHLPNIFTSVDTNTDSVWDARGVFMSHLYWQKPRKTVLGPGVEGLSDDDPSKWEYLFQSSELLGRVGNQVEGKRILTHVLKLKRERGDHPGIARTPRLLSDENRWLGLHEGGIQQVREASGILGELGDTWS